MESLFEYLISKENKKKVTSKFVKSMLTTGDICEMTNAMVLYYMSEIDFRELLKNQPNNRVWDKFCNVKYPEGVLIYEFLASDGGIGVIGLDSFNEDLEYSPSQSVRVAFVYQGEPIDFWRTSEITDKRLHQEMKKRIRIKAHN